MAYDDIDTQFNPEFLGGAGTNPVADYIAQLWRKLTPTQRAPGGLLAPPVQRIEAGVIPNDADLAMEQPGALPPTPRRIIAPRTPGGAFPVTQPAPIQSAQLEEPMPQDIPLGPQMGGGGGVAKPVIPAAPERGLREQYLERLAGMAKPAQAGLTEEQKGMALMEAGLAIMAAAGRPGATALGAIGEGGQKGTVVAREMDRINRERMDKSRAEERANIGTEFQLAGQDRDRAARKEDKEEARTVRREEIARQTARDEATDARESRRIDLIGQQVDAAGWQLKDGADGVVHAYNVRTGEDRKTPLKVKPDDSGRNQQIEFYSWLLKTPGAKEIFTKSDTIDMKDEGKRRAAYGQAYLKASMDPMTDISKFPTFEEYSAKMGIGTAPQRQAPPAAIEFLRKNPAQKDAFRQKYGYLPDGF